MVLKLTAKKTGLTPLTTPLKKEVGLDMTSPLFIISKYLILILLNYIIANIIFLLRSVSAFLTWEVNSDWEKAEICIRKSIKLSLGFNFQSQGLQWLQMLKQGKAVCNHTNHEHNDLQFCNYWERVKVCLSVS